MKKDKKLEEQKIKARMSERAYLQRQLSQKKDYLQTYKFSLKFMVIAIPLAFAVMIGFTVLAYSVFMLVVSILFGVGTIAVFTWLIVWNKSKKPKLINEISQIEQKINAFIQEDNEKYLKMAEQLSRHSKNN